MKPWVLATLNPGKVREFAHALADRGVRIERADALGLRDFPPEDGASYADNARIKARYAAAQTGLLALADDSGIEVDALGGAPGVHSARFGDPNLDDHGRMRHLLERLAGVPAGRRGARYVAVIALIAPSGHEVLFEGRCEGEILLAPRGDGGFGYDPIFYSLDLAMTFAEAPIAAKQAVSHRGRALRALDSYLAGGAGSLLE
jgi:XTP/dITP diphosphohydrolase